MARRNQTYASARTRGCSLNNCGSNCVPNTCTEYARSAPRHEATCFEKLRSYSLNEVRKTSTAPTSHSANSAAASSVLTRKNSDAVEIPAVIISYLRSFAFNARK